jgi:hypothetical protein
MKPTVLTPPPYTPDMLIPPCDCIPLEGCCHSSTFALCSVYSIVLWEALFGMDSCHDTAGFG